MKLFGQTGELTLRGKPIREMSVFFKIRADELLSIGIYGAENSREDLVG
ncbi:MAG: hypothetical protein MUO78_02620 [candidate division Zixibacteria bacterium]|nr:hypothetical protein [candidate division Zixibacteria bacterium]